MKKILPVLLIMAMLLSGCGLSDQLATVKEQYIDPAIKQSETGIVPTIRPSTGAGPNVLTDRAKLTEYVADTAIFTRLQNSYMDTLVTSNSYGRLLYCDNTLLTLDGQIVLDAVYDIAPLSYVAADGSTAYTDQYVLYDGSEYALCASDGSWVTDFAYTEIIGMPLGALCISDLDSNRAVCYATDGSIVFNTANFGELSLLSAGSIESLADYSHGYMRCVFSNDQLGFLSTDGAVLNRNADLPSYFDDALGFTEGLAAVCNSGVWGYIGTDGAFVIERAFSKAGNFRGGVAAVVKDGVWCIIDKTGEVKKQFGGATEIVVESGYFTVDGEYYSLSTLEPAEFYGYEATPCNGGFWVRGDNGVRVFLTNGNQVYFSGAASLIDRSGELWSVELADGTHAVMDANSRVIVFGDSVFTKDAATGETYIWVPDGGLLYNASGVLIASNSVGYVVDGNALCLAGSWQGWKSAGNEWIFRIPSVQTD